MAWSAIATEAGRVAELEAELAALQAELAAAKTEASCRCVDSGLLVLLLALAVALLVLVPLGRKLAQARVVYVPQPMAWPQDQPEWSAECIEERKVPPSPDFAVGSARALEERVEFVVPELEAIGPQVTCVDRAGRGALVDELEASEGPMQTFLVDNTELMAETAGLRFAGVHSGFAPWGEAVRGRRHNSWLRVGDRCLPFTVEGKTVLLPVAELVERAPPLESPEETKEPEPAQRQSADRAQSWHVGNTSKDACWTASPLDTILEAGGKLQPSPATTATTAAEFSSPRASSWHLGPIQSPSPPWSRMPVAVGWRTGPLRPPSPPRSVRRLREAGVGDDELHGLGLELPEDLGPPMVGAFTPPSVRDAVLTPLRTPLRGDRDDACVASPPLLFDDEPLDKARRQLLSLDSRRRADRERLGAGSAHSRYLPASPRQLGGLPRSTSLRCDGLLPREPTTCPETPSVEVFDAEDVMQALVVDDVPVDSWSASLVGHGISIVDDDDCHSVTVVDESETSADSLGTSLCSV